MSLKMKNREDSKIDWIAKAMNVPFVHKGKCDICGRELPGIDNMVECKFECLWCIGDRMFKDLPAKPRLDLEDFCRI